jgi:peptidyl-dipeptidase Dcp
MPEALMSKLLTARRFNQGWVPVEYTASAFVDLKLHLDSSPVDVEGVAFERQELKRIGMPDAIAMRHLPAHLLRRLPDAIPDLLLREGLESALLRRSRSVQ